MKKSLAFFTSICLALSSGFASAVTLNGWDVGNPTAVRASGLVNASKSVGDVTKTSKALITPNASQVSKILRGGVAGAALTVAVNELLDGVDWVLDPANNQIRYYLPNDLSALPKVYVYGCLDKIFHANTQAVEICALADMEKRFPGYFVSASAALTSSTQGYVKVFREDSTYNTYTLSYLPNPNYNPTKEKTLPLDTASQKVIDNAQSGNTDAQVATVAAAQNILNEAENDAEKAKPIVQQLENNSTDLNPPALLSKGRKQNIDNEYVRSVQNKENGDEDPCEWLKNLRNSEPDKAIKKKIKTAEKRFNCDGKNRFDKN